MKSAVLSLFLLACSLISNAQTISGKVKDETNNPLIGASVHLKGTYDGTSTDTTGSFSFTTDEVDTATLVINFLGYETLEWKIKVHAAKSLTLILREAKVNQLREVTITAGSFEASDVKKMTILKPMDIATTAGANFDIFKAMQALPGTTQIGEQEGLFVRGGSASETKAIIDGLIVQNAFFSSVPNVSQRGRFSPFQFKGMAFSTGGYSAQYGQALSSVMIMNSTDLPAQSSLTLGANVVSLNGGYTHRWKNTSISNNFSYFDLKPIYLNLVKQNVDWKKVPSGFTEVVNFQHKTSKTGLLKAYVNYSANQIGLTYADATSKKGHSTFGLKNTNVYSNFSYTENFKKNKLYVGFSQSYNQDHLTLDSTTAAQGDNRTQGRVTLSRAHNDDMTFHAGTELHYYEYKTNYYGVNDRLANLYAGNFLEADIYFTSKLVGRIGVRNEYSNVISRWNLAPRLSLAYKTGAYSQVSFAYGTFYQDPSEKYLYYNKKLDFERADHFIFNYQTIKDGRTFRVETYRKDYNQLVRELSNSPFSTDQYRTPSKITDNSGDGYAQGFDVFFRDTKTIKNAEYWISYSFLDTKRLFANYLVEAMPTFAATHTLNVLYKQNIPALYTQLNFSYNYGSGRPYYNPNNDAFLADRTPDYHNLNVSANYLTNIRGHITVVYADMGNVFATKNIFGYRYSADGTQRITTSPPAYRTFLLGVQITINRRSNL